MSLALTLNDWFILTFSALSVIIYAFIKPLFPKPIRISIWIYIIFLVQSVDYILGVKPYDLYDFMDKPRWEFTYGISHFTLYPVLGYLFLHFYYKNNYKGLKLVTYILICAILSVLFEWTTVQFNVLTYKGWKLWYSGVVYILVFISEVYYFEWIQSLYRKHKKGSSSHA
ncbi:hypothetical protein [Ammoniphilus sp. CFH 90114]|uniref:hypothetical protein n=1 Tax=Ammoniphilus sp. CFH 90114 TaxID=2493665 RepID=UPI00100DDD11|nr:hypothetical protein [Ammoniphilus sp. CFH 90114]RXT07989.1 hypothetical protein EIZ39_11285 [Ammoniphilus sp. CFH 90114]